VDTILELGRAAVLRCFPESASDDDGVVVVQLLHDEAAPWVALPEQIAKLARSDVMGVLQDWRVRLLPAILRFLAAAADPGDAAAALLLLGYSSWRLFDGVICPAIARRSFDKCVRSLRPDCSRPREVSSDPRTAFRVWVEGYLEEHKEKALASAFLEPSKLYWRRMHGPGLMEEHVDAHAANAYAALVERCLGVCCSLPVLWDDSFSVYGATEFLNADFIYGALRAMTRPENFGQGYAKVTRTSDELDGPPAAVPLHGVRFIFAGARTPHEMAAKAMSPSELLLTERATLQPYLERFAHFFSRTYFLEAACAAALADTDGGARVCANAMRLLCDEDPAFAERCLGRCECSSVLRTAGPSSDEALCRALWAFDDYFFPIFDLDAAERLFKFVGGILRPEEK